MEFINIFHTPLLVSYGKPIKKRDKYQYSEIVQKKYSQTSEELETSK